MVFERREYAGVSGVCALNNARAGLGNARARVAGPESPVTSGIQLSPQPQAHNAMATPGVVRIAAVSDLHYSKTSQGSLQPLFAQITESADVLVLAGDLTDYGLAEEAKVLSRDLTTSI